MSLSIQDIEINSGSIALRMSIRARVITQGYYVERQVDWLDNFSSCRIDDRINGALNVAINYAGKRDEDE